MKRTLYLLAGLALFAACSEDPTDDVDDNIDDLVAQTGCRLDEISSEESGETETIKFEYDAEGNVVKMTETDIYTDENGNQVTEVEEIRLIYQNGLPVSAEYMEDGVKEEGDFSFAYADGKLSKIVNTYNEDGQDYIYELRFIYDGNQVVKAEEWYNDYEDENGVDYAGELYLDDYEEITYTGDNITKLEEVEVGEGNEDDNWSVSYTYDDKVNPLRGNLLWLLWEEDYAQFFSANNFISLSESSQYNGNTYTYSQNVTFQYNEDGLPVSLSVSDSDNDTWSHDVSYICED